MIQNKFITYETLEGFNRALLRNDISPKSIVFIKNPAMIWTHNTFFDATERVLLTEEAYETLVENNQVDNNKYYLTYEES